MSKKIFTKNFFISLGIIAFVIMLLLYFYYPDFLAGFVFPFFGLCSSIALIVIAWYVYDDREREKVVLTIVQHGAKDCLLGIRNIGKVSVSISFCCWEDQSGKILEHIPITGLRLAGDKSGPFKEVFITIHPPMNQVSFILPFDKERLRSARKFYVKAPDGKKFFMKDEEFNHFRGHHLS